jgi:hypothetical protein
MRTAEKLLLIGLPIVLRVSHEEAFTLILGFRMMASRLVQLHAQALR